MTEYSAVDFFVRRLGRFLLWRYPALYRRIGLARHKRDCLDRDFEVWFGGYPRSANTFAVAAFSLANRTVRLASHFHVPPFLINCVKCDKPGIFLVRNPEDAAISWTIYWEGRFKIGDSLDYYIDFHRAMSQYIPSLFVAPFEVVTIDFAKVVGDFNQRFGTSYASLPHNGSTVGQCFSLIEETTSVEPNGQLNELVVCRPSPFRANIKPALLRELHTSRRLSRKLETASELYRTFCQAPSRASLTQTPPRKRVQFPTSAELTS